MNQQVFAKKIGIIGIRGKYGRWLNNFLTSRGHYVIGSDPVCGPGIKTIDQHNNRQVVEHADAIIFCVPIPQSSHLMRDLAVYSRADQLWMDITGLKTDTVAAMLESKAEVVGLHPMCAPTVETLYGQTLVVNEARLSTWKKWFDAFVSDLEARVKISTPEHHDHYMSGVQNAPHASNLVMAAVFAKLGINIDESMDFASPYYRLTLGLMGRILSSNLELYADMQMHNPHTLKMLDTMEEELREFKRIVIAKDKAAFIAHFEDARKNFGEKNMKHSNDLFNGIISFMAAATEISPKDKEPR